MLKFLKSLSQIIDRRYLAQIIVGILMIILFVVSDIFYNKISHYLFGLASPFFILLCFILFFLGIISQYKIPIIIKGEEKGKENKDEGDQNPEEKKSTVNIDESIITKIYKILTVLAYLFLITNILSVTYFYIEPYITNRKYTTEKLHIDYVTGIVSNFNYSEKQMIDSINTIVPSNSFEKVGVVNKFSIDTVGFYNYNLTIKKSQNPIKIDTTLNFLNVVVSNNTGCDITDFCNCDSINICLSNSTINYYRLLIYKEGNIIDTLNFLRIGKL